MAPMLHPVLEQHRSAIAGRQAAVTGGAGFIGSHLADALAGLGARVRLLDDLSNGRESNLAGPASAAEFIRGSILDTAALDRAFAGCDTVFHLAALGSVPRSIEDPVPYAEVNVRGTLEVLRAAQRAGARRVLFAASSSAYGNTAAIPQSEGAVPDPCSPYAATKVAGEHLMRAWSASHGLDTVSLRLFNVFGPRQRHDSPYAAVIPAFAHALRTGTAPVVRGDGLQTRDFTFVANVLHGMLLAAAHPGPLAGRTVNVACGEGTSIVDLLSAIARGLGVVAAPRFVAATPGEVRNSRAEVCLAAELFGFRPLVQLDEGLRLTLAAGH